MLSLAPALKSQAASLGFDLCRIAPAAAPPLAAERLAQWLELGRHGDMAWMDNARRGDPSALMPDARCCVIVGLNYAPAADPLAATSKPQVGAVSVYARHRDYHDVMKGRLKGLASWLVARAGG